MAEGGNVSAWKRFTDGMDEKFKHSFLGRYFEVEQRNTALFQELRAGLVAFLTCCYIIPVNSGILADTGGTCDPAEVCNPELYNNPFIGADCRFFDPMYQACQSDLKKQLIAATCIAALISTTLMAVFARMPLCIAPAMGVNAYFTYNVIGYLSTKRVSYKQALAAAFVEGWIFLFISVTGVRGRIVELIPRHIMFSTAAGIGCFLAFIGLQQSEGLGFITFDSATLVTLGGCPPEERAFMYTMRNIDADSLNGCLALKDYIGVPLNVSSLSGSDAANYQLCQDIAAKGLMNNLGAVSPNYSCLGKQVTSPTMWLGIFGGGLMVLLMMKGVQASILVGILFVTFIAWIPSHSATYFGDKSQIGTPAAAQERYDYFLKGATVPSVSMTGGKLDFGALHTSDVWVALITFLYLDFLDATSTMFTMARLIAEKVPGFVNDKGQWPRQLQTMCCDGAAIVIGSLLGTSPLTVFAESAVGIREGGRTGITALVVAAGFGISMFLSPIFASIPPYATGPAIILVGSLMFEHSRHVNWENLREAVPAFLTILMMPLTYSIAYGVICGLLAVIFLWITDGAWKLIFQVLIFREMTMRQLWLDMMSHFYVAFNREEVLLNELPNYKPAASYAVEAKTVDDGSESKH